MELSESIHFLELVSTPKKQENLRKILLGYEADFLNLPVLATDPIEFPRRFFRQSDTKDVDNQDVRFITEFVAILSALYAYGNVKSIKNFLNFLLERIFPNSYNKNFERDSSYNKLQTLLDTISKLQESNLKPYRFQTAKDNLIILRTLGEMFSESKTLEQFFLGEDLEEKINHFQKEFLERIPQKSYGIRFWIGKGERGGSYKRILLFLRWMVRDQFPDFGIYKTIPKSNLLYPIDTHINQFSRLLSISNRTTPNVQKSREITDFFRQLEPEDPLRFDYLLTRIGILGMCKAKFANDICKKCKLHSHCIEFGSATGN